MKALMIAAAMIIVTAGPLMAQERAGQDFNGYVTGLGGFATSIGNTTGDVRLEGGVRVARHTTVFGNLGHFGNLEGELQPTLNAATANLAANQGLVVTGSGTLPAWYGGAGLRVDGPLHFRVAPYVLGGLGVAHLNPSARFIFSSGILPDGSTPDVGSDVTAAVTSAGAFTSPSASNALMLTLGGGVQAPMTRRWAVDAGYRYSRIAADSTLSASAVNVNGMTFGVGYRF
jgi:opacity protein-like surface antigen